MALGEESSAPRITKITKFACSPKQNRIVDLDIGSLEGPTRCLLIFKFRSHFFKGASQV